MSLLAHPDYSAAMAEFKVTVLLGENSMTREIKMERMTRLLKLVFLTPF
jgi:hypothetical protein